MTVPWYIEIKIPITGERKVVSLYCLACGDLLREYERGYVLLDLYSKDYPQVYSPYIEETYAIRQYIVHANKNENSGEWVLRIDGQLEAEDN